MHCIFACNAQARIVKLCRWKSTVWVCQRKEYRKRYTYTLTCITTHGLVLHDITLHMLKAGKLQNRNPAKWSGRRLEAKQTKDWLAVQQYILGSLWGFSPVGCRYDYSTHYSSLDRISKWDDMNYLTLHGIAMHYNTLYCIALHYIAYYTTFCYSALHYTTLHYVTLTTLHDTTQHCMTLRNSTRQCMTLHYASLHYFRLHCTTVHCIAIHSVILQYINYINYYVSLHHITLFCIAWH